MNNYAHMEYESPIKVLCSELTTNFENGVYSAVQKIVPEVDKDELIRALNYDRNQYDRGYRAGYNDALIVLADYIQEMKGRKI